MRFAKTTTWMAAATIAIATVGCSSHKKPQVTEQPFTDTQENNRSLVRAALAQNVQNGNAMERALYACDFDSGHAELNELGLKRVQTLIDAMRNGSGQIVVLQGDAPDALYSQRVASVRRQLDGAGVNVNDVVVVRGMLVGGETSSSKVAILGYDKMLTTYQQHNTTGGQSGSFTGMQSASPSGASKE